MNKRAGLACKSVKGESKSVNLEESEKWKTKLSELISGYQPKDIFNMEWEFFYNILPDKTYAYKGEKCHGERGSKAQFENNIKVWITIEIYETY